MYFLRFLFHTKKRVISNNSKQLAGAAMQPVEPGTTFHFCLEDWIGRRKHKHQDSSGVFSVQTPDNKEDKAPPEDYFRIKS